MANEIRLGQLIAPFGPGSIYTDKNGVPTIICGLDYWYAQKVEEVKVARGEKKKWRRTHAIDSQNIAHENGEAVTQSLIIDNRLSELLKIPFLRLPPPRWQQQASLIIPGHRFPTWYINNANGALKKFNFETIRPHPERNDEGKRILWKPVRFVSVCQNGHIGEFPWKAWCGCTCLGDDQLVLNDSGGVDLSSIKVTCRGCKKSANLTGATRIERDEQGKMKTGLSAKNIHCHGERPWLGRKATQPACDQELAAVLINQSNIYFGKTVSSIFIPHLGADEVISDIHSVFQLNEKQLVSAKLLKSIGDIDSFIQMLKPMLAQKFIDNMPSDEEIIRAFDSFGSVAASVTLQPETIDSELLAYRRAECTVLRGPVTALQCPDLNVIPGCAPVSLSKLFSKVNLVERLRETKVFYGFERLVRQNNPLANMPGSAMNQLFLQKPRDGLEWLPAARNYGEGIYIELQEKAINKWVDSNQAWLQARFDNDFIGRMSAETLLLPPKENVDWQWASRYLLVHTLAHVLINQLVFECGYSTAALKERLYVSSDSVAPMAGMLIYTASGDSEGSLGGLVRLGRAELFEPMVRRAISRASWCSADPVCSENLGGSGSRLINKAACHACVLLPETACETINNGLDRSVVVGTPDNPSVGFLSELLDLSYSV